MNGGNVFAGINRGAEPEAPAGRQGREEMGGSGGRIDFS